MCQPSSSERNVTANARPTYAILSNILIEIVVKEYKVVGINTLHMIMLFSIITDTCKRFGFTTLDIMCL
jgi:hypothetical protein